MKILLLAMCVIAVQMSAPVPRQTATNPTSSTHPVKKNAAANQEPATPTITAENANGSPANQETRNTPTNPHENITVIVQQPTSVSDWEKAYVLLTAALVIVGGVGVGYALKTLKAVERQAQANEDTLTEIRESAEKTDRMILLSAQEAENGKAATDAAKKSADAAIKTADAALKHAQAIVNSERPWMFIAFDRVNSARPAFQIGFRNWGRTPAEIVGFHSQLTFGEVGDSLGLPDNPSYRDEGMALKATRLIPPRKRWDAEAGYTCYVEESFPADIWKEITQSKKRAIYWGRLRYRDLIADAKSIHALEKPNDTTLHETCFCYWWSPSINEFLIGGPVAYNKHT